MKYLYMALIGLFISTAAIAQAVESEVISTNALEIKPEYPGGINEFYKYIGNNFRTPEVESNMVLKVNVSFVVEKDGTITNITVVKDPGYGMAEEAIRVLKACPEKWYPGVQNGKPVRAQYMLPIVIKVTVEDTETEKQ